MGNDGFALGRQLIDQSADPHLVVGVGSFERSNFLSHNALKLTRTAKGAFDTLGQCSDFSAHRIGDRADAPFADGCRFGQRVGGVRHRARRQTEFGRTPRKGRERPEAHDGKCDQREQTDQRRAGEDIPQIVHGRQV